MYPIDKDIPIPEIKRNNGRANKGHNKRPWLELEIGDSFIVPNGKRGTESSGASLASKRHNRGFTSRVVDGGVRIWRVR